MPRQARKESGSGIYHVMLRGVNRQVIFQDDEDRIRFLTVLKNVKAVSGFRLHAFCLMPNHVHLLMEQAGEPLGTVFKRIGVSYAGWYNKKYDRVGHLFQDRFRSENVETDQYYMTALRYILWNPVKAGMVSAPGRYRWSSYLAYEKGTGSLTDTEYAERLFGLRERLMGFLREDSKEAVMDEEAFDRHFRDDLAAETFRRITNCESASGFQKLEESWQKAYIRELYLENLTTVQIARLTGKPRSNVCYLVKGLASARKESANEQTSPVFREADEVLFLPDDGEIW